MPVDTSKSNQKIPTKSGEILFDEGSPCDSLNLLHEGSFTTEKNIDGILVPLSENSGKNLTPGVASLFFKERYDTTILSTSEGVLSTYQITRSTIKKNIMAKSSLGVAISKSLLKEVLDIQKKATHIHALNSKVEALLDNLSLSLYFLQPEWFPDISLERFSFSEDDQEKDPVLRTTKRNLSNYLERGGTTDFKPSKVFLLEGHGEYFKKKYSLTVEFLDKEFVFIRKILSLQQALQNTVYEADITILIQICEKLADSFYVAIDSVEENTKHLHSNLKLLLGKTSILERALKIYELIETGAGNSDPKDLQICLESLQSEVPSILETYKSLFQLDFQDIHPQMSILRERISRLESKSSAKSESTVETIQVTEDYSGIQDELEHSASKIFNFVKFPQDQIKEYSALIAKFKSLKNPLDPEQDARTLRRNITKIYWDVFHEVSKKYIQSPNVPRVVEMMIHYGYFDETLLDDSHKVFLYKTKPDRFDNAEIPLHQGMDWLDSVSKKKAPASISELGETYFDKIKAESKDVVYKRESDVPPNIDTPEKRLKYEFDSLFVPNARLVTGNPMSFFPILTNFQILSPLSKCLLTHKSLTNALAEILKIDYTAFNREVIYNNEKEGILKELIQTSVYPDFIAIPSIGTKIMMWQDLGQTRGAGSKETRGRIILPIFIQGDLKTMLMDAIAAFRWELCKSIMGVEWNNVGVPSLTADYTDYVMFYKKNRDISIELKEKISSDFKRFRTDRDKFVNDYILWLKYESEGIQKLNKVVRNIFYKYIPFQKEIRDKVSTLPAFADIHNRFSNIRTRQFKELEAKYRKYQESHGSIPPKIQANLDFYRV